MLLSDTLKLNLHSIIHDCINDKKARDKSLDHPSLKKRIKDTLKIHIRLMY